MRDDTTHMSHIGDRDIRCAPRQSANRGAGQPPRYKIDISARCNFVRNCRICGGYDSGMLKIGKRAYAHVRCFVGRYGPLDGLATPTPPIKR